MSLGAFLGESELFNVGINQWFITLGSMRSDGSLPIETRRGARALFYHGRTLTGLSSLAEKAKVQGVDLWNTAPSETKTVHLAVKFLIDAIENPDLVLGYASINKSPGPSKNYQRQDIGSGSTFGWIAPYMARFPDHPNTKRMLRRISDPDAAIQNYLTINLDRQIQMNGTGSGDWNFVNGRCFYSEIQ
jgi:poly(beta-D-mannuronate) lyase